MSSEISSFFYLKIIISFYGCVIGLTRQRNTEKKVKKILLIHTGGTFGMAPLEPDDILAPGNFQEEILNHVPELSDLARIRVEIPFNLDSANLGQTEWDRLAQIIYDKMDLYDGFVVIHGTDTMAYTASALSFSLLNLRKPVVLTGAQRPLSKLRNDARTNLIDAVELSTMAIPEVMIVFGQRIIRGNRAKKVNIYSYNAFESPNFPYLGTIGVNIDIDHELLLQAHGSPVLLGGFISKVAVISIHPSLTPQYFEPLIESDIQVLILQGFGAGNLPGMENDWVSFVEQLVAAGKNVFIASHSFYGGVKPDLYESGHKALRAGAQSIGKMTIEAAYVKLQKILTLTSEKQSIYERFNQNWAGEI